MDSIIVFQAVARLVSSLDISWRLAGGGVSHHDSTALPSVGADAQTTKRLFVAGAIDELQDALESCRTSARTLGGADKDAALGVLAQKSSRLAQSILHQSPGLDAGHRQIPWEDVRAARHEMLGEEQSVSFADEIDQLGHQMRDWLIGIITDGKSAFNTHLDALQKDADDVSSVRSRELAFFRNTIRSAIKRPGKAKDTTTGSRRYPASASARSSSDESSDEDSRRKQRAKGRLRRRRVPANSATSSKPTVSLQDWLPLVNDALASLLRLSRAIPVEVCLLKGLVYESIHSREDSIHDAESGTFSWLLQDPVDAGLPAHMSLARESFISWLNSEGGVFHVSGKAGSGKSTLMKFLHQHPRTTSELGQWAGEKGLIFSSFYFWNSGTPMQMSLEGLYRSVLLEVLRQCPDLMPSVFPEQWNTLSAALETAGTGPALFDATTIQDAFDRLLEQDSYPEHRICFFIDGLDEYKTGNVDYWLLARKLLNWPSNKDVKLCVSSRPYTEFLNTFSEDHRLHLHELTSRDIKDFAAERFSQQGNMISIFEVPELDALVDVVVQKSEGVFLWAICVIRSLVALVLRGASADRVRLTLEDYPSDIEGLYDRILGSLQLEERDRSNRMLLLAARNPFAQPLNALWFAWLDEMDDVDFLALNRPYSAAQIRQRHEIVRKDLEWLTKGLLEMHADRRERKDGDQFYRQRIHFFHRTARDYLQSPGRLRELGHVTGLDGSSLLRTYSRLRVAEILLPGKYRVAQGADPRRRRLYFNYARSLFILRDGSGSQYQHPLEHMERLRQDLLSTETEAFSGCYAVSSYKSVSNLNRGDEDPEKPASFLHFAASHGQHDYAMSELPTTQAAGRDDLSVLLSAAFGPQRFTPEAFATLLRSAPSPLSKIRVKPSLWSDPLSTQSSQMTVVMIFVGVLVFACLGKPKDKGVRDGKSLERKHIRQLFAMLKQLLDAAQEEHSPQGNSLEFICLLRPKKAEDGDDRNVLFTTLGQVVLQHERADASGPIASVGGPRYDALPAGIEGLGASGQVLLPAWAQARLSGVSGYEKTDFIDHERLSNYYCTRITSAAEELDIDKDLFFRLY